MDTFHKLTCMKLGWLNLTFTLKTVLQDELVAALWRQNKLCKLFVLTHTACPRGCCYFHFHTFPGNHECQLIKLHMLPQSSYPDYTEGENNRLNSLHVPRLLYKFFLWHCILFHRLHSNKFVKLYMFGEMDYSKLTTA